MSIEPNRALVIHDQLLETVRAKRRIDRRTAMLLAELADGGHHQDLGYATIRDYARAELGLSRRNVTDLLRVGRRLPDLPAMDEALAEGRLDFTKARELLRVVTPENAPTWVDRAEAVTSRELERLIRAGKPGEPPPDVIPPPELRPARRRFVFELESADAEAVFAALAAIRAEAGARGDEIDDSIALATLARQLLASTAVTHEPYRVVVHTCASCGETSCGESEVSDTVAAEAACDAEVVELREGPDHGHVTRVVPPARRRAVLARDRERCVVPGCSSRRWLHVHHLRHRADGGDHSLGNLVTLCGFHHRLLHDGRLAVERLADGRLRVEHADGRTHVGPGAGPDGWGPPSEACAGPERSGAA